MPTVALLTDFGTRDHYVGAMKGTVLSVCPEATLVDITHDIPPHDVMAASLELAAAFGFFPPATVFVAVVDPGVGSTRRAIAAAAGGYYFVGPDNGLFTHVFRDAPASLIVELQERKFARSTISRTFEGRDRFAPAAGWIARGTELGAFGPSVDNPVMLNLREPRVSDAGIDGEIIRVDRFGNLMTNISGALVEQMRQPAFVEIGERRIPVAGTYSDVSVGQLCGLIGSTGLLEIAMNTGSAEQELRVGRGTMVRIRR